MSPRVTIGTISGGAPRLSYVRSILASQGAGHAILIRDSHAYLDMSRNDVVSKFMETDSEWLLMVDDDIGYTEDHVQYVTGWDPAQFPIVTGLYANNFPEVGVVPLAYKYRYNENSKLRQHCIMSYNEFWNLPRVKEHLVEIDGCGGGFLAMHRSVLKHMYEEYGKMQPWFAQLVLGDVWTGEDLMFCLRAKTLGYAVMADVRATLTHDKRVQYTVRTPQ